MVTANHRVAALAGVKVLEKGGHAADAAVATSLMLGVCEPWMSGLGGCGQMLIFTAATGRVEVIDFSTVSPMNLVSADYPLTGQAGDTMFGWPGVKDDRNNMGATSVCLPTLPRALDVLHRRYGRMSWVDLVLPTAAQAERGLEIDAYASLFIGSAARELASNDSAKAQFLDPDGLPPTIAWTNSNVLLRPMPKLAKTLRTLAYDGADSFYVGSVANAMIREIQRLGSCLTLEEMATYMPKIEEARTSLCGDHTVHVSPEMNAGTDLQEVLGHTKTGAGPVASEEIVELIAKLRDVQERREENTCQPRDGCTTHFNVVDGDGNMVVVTQTLLSVFGSKILCEDTGVLLNNGLLWFDPRPGRANSIGFGKRPLSNMCPVIVTGQNLGVLGIGAAGGRKILPAVCQILWRLLCKGETLDQAFHAPRFDTSQASQVSADRRLDPALLSAIAEHYALELTERHIYPYAFACPSAIQHRQKVNTGCTETFSLWGDSVLVGKE